MWKRGTGEQKAQSGSSEALADFFYSSGTEEGNILMSGG